MSTTLPSERLQTYFPFDENLLDRIDGVATNQNHKSFRWLADEYNIAAGTKTVHPYDDERQLEYLLLKPVTDYDEAHIRVLYNNMATPIDKSTAMRAMRLFAAGPNTPLMVVGSPSAIGIPTNIPRKAELSALRSGDFSVLAAASLRHIADRRVSSIDVLGYSLGADVAAGAAQESARYDLQARKAVWAEPVQLARPGSVSLANRFRKAGVELENYVYQSNSPPLIEARKQADTGMLRYIGGLLRPVNLATIHALARSNFGDRAENALARNPTLTAEIIRGSESELCDPATARNTYHRLAERFPRGIGSMVMQGMHHAGCDDIDLHAAMMLQALEY